jgi:hypothetical protein
MAWVCSKEDGLTQTYSGSPPEGIERSGMAGLGETLGSRGHPLPYAYALMR